MQVHAAERGLAYDLVGDNARAQQEYAVSLSMGADPEVVRRLALSQAIAGDQRASETTLLPLLQRRDLAAYRTRAFALAILGKDDEAVSIAETMLPERLSSRLAPYLRYMPRLTRAQQAAAANLGMFPRAAEIGRDDPAIAAYAAPAARRAAGAHRGLAAGAERGSRSAAATAPALRVASRAAGARPRVRRGSAPRSRPTRAAAAGAGCRAAPSPRSPSRRRRPTPRASRRRAPSRRPGAAAPQPVVAAAEPPIVGPVDDEPGPVVVAASPQSASPRSRRPVDPAAGATRRRAAGRGRSRRGLRRLHRPPRLRRRPPPARSTSPRSSPAARPRARRPPPLRRRRRSFRAAQWVQVATGRDVAALEFDWRRIKRNAGGLLDKYKPYVAAWGQTNRLVAGPVRERQRGAGVRRQAQGKAARFLPLHQRRRAKRSSRSNDSCAIGTANVLHTLPTALSSFAQ